jgi:F0F1-type ATP synthase membrane subunit b/b'
MNLLIDSILSVENEANALIEQARAEAKALEKQADNEIAALQQEIAAKVEQQVAAFRETAGKRHEAEVAKEGIEARKALESVDRISGDLISRQVDKIVSRFREI